MAADPLAELAAGRRTAIDGLTALAVTDGRTATERMAADGGPPLILVDLALDYASATRVALAPADQSGPDDLARAAGLFQALGKQVSRLDDVPGMLVMRTVCMLANEAADAVNQGVSDAAAVDTAMRLAVNYPRGPLGLGRRNRPYHRHDRARQPRRRLWRGPLPHLAAPAPPPTRRGNARHELPTISPVVRPTPCSLGTGPARAWAW